MRPFSFLLGVAFVFFFFQGELFSAGENASPPRLRVVTRVVEPFVVQKEGKLTGYSIELWELAAARAGLQYEYRVVETVPELLQSLREGGADVVVGALTVSQEREKTIDFSYPIHDSGLKIAVPPRTAVDYLVRVDSFSLRFFVLMIVLFMVAVSFAWLMRRDGGFRLSVWIAILVVIFLVVGVGINNIRISNHISRDIQGLSDLPGRKVGTLAGTSADLVLQDMELHPVYYSSLRGALKDLQDKKLDAVVYDAPMLAYLAKEADGKVALLPAVFSRQTYGFGMKENSGNLRKNVNEALLALTEEGMLEKLGLKWFGKDGG